jgi:Flp pilus assembly protein TadG
MMNRHRRFGGPEQGSAAIEAAILVPVLLVFVLMALAAGRIVLAEESVNGAAADAAREASLSRTPDGLLGAAQQTALQTLHAQGLHCADGGPSIQVNVSDFGQVGQVGTVTATVVCVVSLGDLGMGADKTVRAQFTSVVDAYRTR